MAKVSVIIPCYNAEQTIENTLESVRKQSYSNYEIIIVDDGSNDGTYKVAKQYKEAHSGLHIHLLKQENAGVSAARNLAIDAATGDYIAFLDADDVYHKCFLEHLITSMENVDCDISMCKYQNDSFIDGDFKEPTLVKMTKAELLDMYFHKRVNKLNFGGALYKKKILDQFKIRFSNGVKYGEDTEFFGTYLYHCSTVAFIDAALYGYIICANSAMHKIDYKKSENIRMFQNVLEYWGNELPEGSEYIIARATWSCLKDFAMYSSEMYERFQKEFDVRSAMKLLVKNEKEKPVVLTALMYIASPKIFGFAMKAISWSDRR